ncbi:MAG TPA: hypothetical protein VGN52_13275 [Burkholderiales bacterium]
MIASALNSLMAVACVMILLRIQAQTIRGRVVALFFWGIVFFPWLEGLLMALNLYPPRVRVPDNMLFGAALFDVFRLLCPLVLIIWLSFNSRARDYMHARWRAPSLLDDGSPLRSAENG